MISIAARPAAAGFGPPQLSEDCLEAIEKPPIMIIALRSAFPLPETGAFTDLLAAIDEGDAGSSHTHDQ